MEDDSNPIILFLNEDLDTIPERHAFLGNYRRFCQSIVESMVRKRPFEAFPYIMSQAENSLTGIYSRSPSVNRKSSCRSPLPSSLSSNGYIFY
jgi:exportin-5